jgi:hypothetical protein
VSLPLTPLQPCNAFAFLRLHLFPIFEAVKREKNGFAPVVPSSFW